MLPYYFSASTSLIEPYFRKFYTEGARTNIRQILNDIKDEMKEVANELIWLDDDARKLIQDKLASSEDYVTFGEYFENKKVDGIFNEVPCKSCFM